MLLYIIKLDRFIKNCKLSAGIEPAFFSIKHKGATIKPGRVAPPLLPSREVGTLHHTTKKKYGTKKPTIGLVFFYPLLAATSVLEFPSNNHISVGNERLTIIFMIFRLH